MQTDKNNEKISSVFTIIKREAMKKLLIIIACLIQLKISAQVREVDNFNSGWKFMKGDLSKGYDVNLIESDFRPVNLPHTYNVNDSFDNRTGDDLLDITYYYYRGPAWYRKNFDVEEKDKGKRIFISFEAANAVAEVWVNENYAGKHIGGYSGFQFDITKFVNFGEKNLIAVRVDNSYNYNIPPHRADYTMYGGIYRDVHLIKVNPLHLDHSLVSVVNPSESSADIKMSIPVVNNYSSNKNYGLFIEVFDPANKKVLEFKNSYSVKENRLDSLNLEIGKIANPLLWSPDFPNLYRAQISLINDGKTVDVINEKFGIRWYRFDPNEGFFINGKYLKLHGVNRHQDREGFGNALSNKQHLEDMVMIKNVGANFVRLAHYQQDPAVLNACDSLGIFVWEEIPVVTSVGKEKFKDNALSMLKEMITQHYNHPSIIIWGLMNETVRDQPDDELYINVDLCKSLSSEAKKNDPYRLTAQAQMDARGEDIFKYTDIRGWNRYLGWYSGKFSDFGKFMDEQHKLAPNQPFIISEYGAGSKRGYHFENPTTPDFSEEWQLEFHRSYWKQILERKWIAGSLVWVMFDFASDEKAGNILHINQKGLADFNRKPKDLFYFYQSQWSKKPMIYIVSHTWTEREGKRNEKKTLEIFSNCDTVEVSLNGKSWGRKYNSPFTWKVEYAEGQNIIEAVGKKGSAVVNDSLRLNYRIEAE